MNDNSTTQVRSPSLLALSWPIFIEQGLHVLVGTVDTLMVSYVSDDAVAALGQSSQVVFLSLLIFNFIGIGSSVVTTHHIGASDPQGACRVARTAIAVNTWIGVVVSLLVLLLAAPLLRLMHLPATLLPLAMQFLPLMGGTLFLEAQNIAMGAVLRAHGHTRESMWVTAIQNIVNLAGIFVLLFGALGFPRMGITGVAIASVVSRLVAFFVLRQILRRRTSVRMNAKAYFSWPAGVVQRILHIGLPAAGENFSWSLAFMVVTSFTARLGPTALATQSYTMQVGMWVVLFGISIGLGTELMIGRKVGAGAFDEAYHELFRSLRIGVILAICSSTLVGLFAPQLLRLFTSNPMVIAGGTVLLRIAIAIEPGRAFNLVVINSLRATGDSRFPLLVGIASMWGLWVPFSYVLGLWLGLGLPGIWFVMIVDEWLRGLVMYRRWKTRRWLTHATRSRAQTALAAAHGQPGTSETGQVETVSFGVGP